MNKKGATVGMATGGKVLESYDEWLAWAEAEDERRGLDAWKREETSNLYDYGVIRARYDELVETRASGDAQRLLFYLNEGLHGNMGGMGAPQLYAKARVGTKELITRYIDEIVAALADFEAVAEAEIDQRTKVDYFQRARGCFGRSALMFSGAGSLGAFHIGVAKALAEQELLPSVVSGSSAGSVVAAVIGTHAADELPGILARGATLMRDAAANSTSGGWGMPQIMRQQDVYEMIQAAIPDMTFLEAYEQTGYAINVSVAPSRLHQRSRLLNATTSPNALIREAALASCAVPGVFSPVTLYARNAAGERQPYVPSRKWIDGSVSDDLPARRLARLYGINHFISSQTNPMVFWMLQDPDGEKNLLSRWTTIYQSAVRDWMRAVYPFVMDTVRNFYPMNVYTRAMFGLATQEYTADINILPQQRFFDPTRLLSPLSEQEAHNLIQDGERATWPKVEMIRNCTKVSRQIDGALVRLTGHA
ncbi:MAG: DUF3336 domain-containing protein [Pseudomonadota bacterium]